MRFRLLRGPVELLHEGRFLSAGRRQEQHVLAILLIDVGRGISLNGWRTRLWDDELPGERERQCPVVYIQAAETFCSKPDMTGA